MYVGVCTDLGTANAAATLVRVIGTVCLTLVLASPAGAQQPKPRNILLLNSLQRDSFSIHNERFRTALRRLVPEPLNVFELLVRPTPSGQVPDDEPLIDYLRSTVAGQPLDLVVSVGGPAAVFVRTHQQQLFPGTPILASSLDVRWLRDQPGSHNETAVSFALDIRTMIEDILVALPDTKHLAVVIGTSPLEAFWRKEMGREFEQFGKRLEFVFLDGLSLPQILDRTSTLPAHSAIFYPIFSVDGAGVSQSEEDVLAQLHARANAPVFGLYDYQVGAGIVGGSLLPITESAQQAAEVAHRLLQGEAPSTITTAPLHFGPPTYDWRELRRWGISESRLPVGSLVQFRPPGLWDQYRNYVLAAAMVFTLQTALIAGLVIQRTRRRRTELALRESELRFRATAERNHDLAGRLISAQEAERTRIARDLHDDLSQQLAGLGIMLSGLRRRVGTLDVAPDIHQTVTTLQDRTSALARSIRTLSHELHPSVLQHAGLVATLRSHCEEVEVLHHVAVTFGAEGDLDSLEPEVALCLFRVAQEAITNAIRHARPATIDVRLVATAEGVEFSVIDDGAGFVTGERASSGLGLRSIDERVRLAKGHVTVASQPGQGTTLIVRIPQAAHAAFAGQASV